MSHIKIISTSDGSHSLLNTSLNETYHSVHGAIQESKHVFIQNGLDFWISRNPAKEPRILEIGFGTGLNVLLTLLHGQSSQQKIYYESWEMYPLDQSVVRELNYGLLLEAGENFSEIHNALWNSTVALSPHFTLHKHLGSILIDSLTGPFDLVYYDAFAPSKQAEMWTIEALKKITNSIAPGGVWVTYCAKGQLKRDLKALGLNVETLPGPPGKKEMVRATAP